MARANEPIVVSEKFPHAVLGRKIQRARVRAGLTQEQLAQAARITRRQMIRLEKGEHRPGSDVLARIGDATKQEPAFFGLEQEVAPPGGTFRGHRADDGRGGAASDRRATPADDRPVTEEA